MSAIKKKSSKRGAVGGIRGKKSHKKAAKRKADKRRVTRTVTKTSRPGFVVGKLTKGSDVPSPYIGRKSSYSPTERAGHLLEYNRFRGTVEFSGTDGILFGRVIGIPDIVTYEGTTVADIAEDFREAVDDYREHCAEDGGAPPKPFENYSGKFNLRIDPEVHCILSTIAERRGISLNELIEQTLKNAVT